MFMLWKESEVWTERDVGGSMQTKTERKSGSDMIEVGCLAELKAAAVFLLVD